jgi:hypothetical protein
VFHRSISLFRAVAAGECWNPLSAGRPFFVSVPQTYGSDAASAFVPSLPQAFPLILSRPQLSVIRVPGNQNV